MKDDVDRCIDTVVSLYGSSYMREEDGQTICEYKSKDDPRRERQKDRLYIRQSVGAYSAVENYVELNGVFVYSSRGMKGRYPFKVLAVYMPDEWKPVLVKASKEVERQLQLL